METLTDLFYFLVCSALIGVAWLVFLFFNNLIDKMQRGIFQGFLGTVNTVTLLAAIGAVVSYFALSFFAGILFVMIVVFLFYAGKKAMAGLSST